MFGTMRFFAAGIFVIVLGGTILSAFGEGPGAPTAVPATAPTTGPAAAALAPAPAGPFEVFPPDVNLETARDFQSVVVRVTQPDGVTRDVTASPPSPSPTPALAKVEGQRLPPLADGAGATPGQVRRPDPHVPVTVKDGEGRAAHQLQARRDAGLHASPAATSAAATAAPAARTASASRSSASTPTATTSASPASSPPAASTSPSPRRACCCTKATGKVPHTGGTRFKEDDELYNDRSSAGSRPAPRRTPPTSPSPSSLELLPEADGAGRRRRRRSS